MFQSEEILFWEEKLLNEEIIVFSKICGLGKSSIWILNAGSKRKIAYGSSYRAEVHISQKISFFLWLFFYLGSGDCRAAKRIASQIYVQCSVT